MQTSVRNCSTSPKEPSAILEMYGPDVKRPGSYARNCSWPDASSSAESAFVQIMHSGWDQHGNLDTSSPSSARPISPAPPSSRPEQRGSSTKPSFSGAASSDAPPLSRAMSQSQRPWPRPPGLRLQHVDRGRRLQGRHRLRPVRRILLQTSQKIPSMSNGLQATILRALGIDHTRLTYRIRAATSGSTDVYGNVVAPLLA